MQPATHKDHPLPRAVIWAGVLGAVLTIVAAKGNLPGIGNDATSYVAIAQRLNDGRGLGYFLEPVLALWPPGWPAVLALFDRIGINPQVGGLLVNALLVIGLSIVAAAITQRLTGDRRLVTIAGVVAALGPATLGQSYFVQTETSFMVLVLACFAAIFMYQDTGRRKWFWWSAVFVWAAFMDRYVAIVAIGAVALWLCVDMRSGATFADRLRRGVGYFLAANIVPALWILRTVIASGTPFGPRDTPLRTYPDNLNDAITSLGQFLHGYAEYKPADGVLALASVALFAAVVGAAIWMTIRWWQDREPGATAPTVVSRAVGSEAGLLAIYAVAHAVYMVYSASTIAFDPVNTRYLNPVFIPAMIAGLAMYKRAWPTTGTLATVGSFALVAFAAVQVVSGVVRVSAPYWHDQAQGYNSPIGVEIRKDPLLAEIPTDCTLYSNLPEFGYTAGFESLRSPRARKFASSDPTDDLDVLDANLADGPVCLIWFDDDNLPQVRDLFETSDYQYPLAELQSMYRLDKIAGDDVLTIFAVGNR